MSLILENQKNYIPGAIKLMEEYVRLSGELDGEQRLERLRTTLRAAEAKAAAEAA